MHDVPAPMESGTESSCGPRATPQRRDPGLAMLTRKHEFSRGINLQDKGELVMRIARKFTNMEQVKALSLILLGDGGYRYFERITERASPPEAYHLAHEIISKWMTKKPEMATGRNFLDALKRIKLHGVENFASNLGCSKGKTVHVCSKRNEDKTKKKRVKMQTFTQKYLSFLRYLFIFHNFLSFFFTLKKEKKI